MADNVTLNSMSGGQTVRAVSKGGFETQVITLDVGGSGAESLISGTVPVSGTVSAAQSGTWTVTTVSSVTAIANALPAGTNVIGHVIVDSGTITANAGSGTFAVSAASLPLPSGAATLAKQPALGTAGTASSDVITVQGITSMTALKVDGSGVTQPVSIASSVTVAQATAASLNATVVGTGTFAVQAAQSGTWNVGTVTSITAIAGALPAGSNVIGHVIVDSGTVTTVSTVTAVTAITNALPAGTNLLGQISASAETATVYSGTTALTPKFAVITASSSGATTIVAAVSSKKIRVLRWSLAANAAVNIKWQSHVTPTDLTGLHYMTQFSTAGGSYCPVGIFQTVSGEALDINLSGSVAVGGELTYVEV